ncbi:MAG: DNA topoisomerase 3 [Veillonella sp.]|uniref:DNA topoisomerase 3 n=1 Tax=Veillonella sp. TaxID=1926307 RepID=UPI0025F78B21|nr:DNA topoisomerase 3 [Veillonella sp.]MBS4912562.1 DNA topoisomerase 3 [Veillonella sp.]
MRLFIAEKPSMGREISKYLPEQQRVQRRDGYIIQGDDVVTWAFGHVLEQAEPGDYDPKYKRWNAADLPIVPEEWKLLITKSSEKQFHTIKDLIEKADVIVNAGDPDREGQLLIDEILLYVNNEKPVQRILLNALDEKSIRQALGDLRDNKDFYNLQQSALARARADWLIGMNLSRAYTLAQRRRGNKVTFPIGRVKTPTLALVVRRERELENFVPVDYYTLKVLYVHPNGTFWATWQPQDDQIGLDPEGRLLKREVAEELAKRLMDSKTGIIEKREKNKKKEAQRLPLSLSALQVAAGKAYGYDPQQVLDTAQKLYEKKLTTYPRSDCDYLPQNQYADRTAIIKNLSANSGKIGEWASKADLSIKSRAWNDKKITAHHAIIPTTVPCNMETLPQMERNIYFLIAQSYIAQFYKEHEYEQTKLTVLQEEERFVAHGRVVIEPGWKVLFQKAKKTAGSGDDDSNDSSDDDNMDWGSDGADEAGGTGDGNGDGSGSIGASKKQSTRKSQPIEDSGELPAVKKGDTVTVDNIAIDAKQTKPPSRFTAATLLQAMKEIHKYVKNEDLKKQLKAVSGIGTEATRATIIDELINRKFMSVKGKKKVIQPTDLGYLLVDALPEEMLYPDETAVWEERLAAMSEGEGTLDNFLSDQVDFLRRLIQKANTGDMWGNHDGIDTDGFNIASTVRVVKGRTGAQGGDGEVGYANGPRNAPVPDADAPDCPKCGKGKLMKRKGKFGEFYGCSQFPTCRYTRPVGGDTGSMGNGPMGATQSDEQLTQSISKAMESAKTQDALTYQCPRCGGHLVNVMSGNRSVWRCSKFPQCRTTVADVNGKPSIYK